jgi:BMFP domain-containing protein YqiC
MTSKEQVTVSDLSELIEAREETRAELRLLAIRAYEHWLDLESKIEALEQRLDQSRTSSAAPPPVEPVAQRTHDESHRA